jgi:Domain of unknown function (DUF3471)
MKTLVISLFLAIAMASVAMANPPKSAKTAPADSLQEYVGNYKMVDGTYFQYFKITLVDGALYGEADANGANKLIKQKEPEVFQSTSQYGSIITFIRDKVTKKVTELNLNIQNTDLKAVKE